MSGIADIAVDSHSVQFNVGLSWSAEADCASQWKFLSNKMGQSWIHGNTNKACGKRQNKWKHDSWWFLMHIKISDRFGWSQTLSLSLQIQLSLSIQIQSLDTLLSPGHQVPGKGHSALWSSGALWTNGTPVTAKTQSNHKEDSTIHPWQLTSGELPSTNNVKHKNWLLTWNPCLLEPPGW